MISLVLEKIIFSIKNKVNSKVSFLLQRYSIETKIFINMKKQKAVKFLDHLVEYQIDTFRFNVETKNISSILINTALKK